MALKDSFLLLACLLGLAGIAQAIVVGDKSVDPTCSVLARICKNKEHSCSLTYCWPRASNQYVKCENPHGKLYTCPAGTAYDYAKRQCIDKKVAKICGNLHCPEDLPGVATVNLTAAPFRTYGMLFRPDLGMAFNISFPKASKYRIFCPSLGHCESGMSFEVIVKDEPNPSPKIVDIGKYNEYDEVLKGSDRYPQHLKTITLKKGDKLHIDWDEPIHSVGVYDMMSAAAKNVPVAPYPPQPTYACPDWPLLPDGTVGMVPGETRLIDLNLNPPPSTEYTWTATKPGQVWFACSLPNHCRLGQVFRTVVDTAPHGYKPKTHIVSWMLTDYENFPDMNINVGDKIKFVYGGSQPFHMLSTFEYLRKY